VIRPFGEAAILVEVGDPERAQALAASLRGEPPNGVTGAVPGRASVLVEFDPDTVEDLEAVVRSRLGALTGRAPSGRMRRIPVVYGGEHGPDLAGVADIAGLTEMEVVERHAAAALKVLFDGFAPGFAYVGGLPDELHVPRLATPRTRTPAGSVAIADGMSGVYPAELPGGWRVIGRTPISLFDPHRPRPAYLEPGDRVRFDPIDAADWSRFAGPPGDW
jgi:KipI family sensor histidine kinase inhibitor